MATPAAAVPSAPLGCTSGLEALIAVVLTGKVGFSAVEPKPINAFNVAITARRYRNRRTASQEPNGRPMMQPMATAVRVTCSDSRVISIRSGSAVTINRIASTSPANRSSMDQG